MHCNLDLQNLQRQMKKEVENALKWWFFKFIHFYLGRRLLPPNMLLADKERYHRIWYQNLVVFPIFRNDHNIK